MNKQLPEYIGLSGLSLFLYVAFKLKSEQGFSLASNVTCKQKSSEQPYYVLWADRNTNECKCWGSGSKERAAEGCRGKIHWINSVKEFNELLDGPRVMIATYEAKLSEDGVQVGCTFVKWEEVDALIEARKQMNP